MKDSSFKKTAIHFTHANGIPAPSYQKFFACFEDEFDLKSIPMIGLNPQYPITHDWRYLVDQIIDDIEQKFHGRKVIGLGHSFGSLLTLMSAYKRPDLFSQLVIMDPPFVIGSKSPMFEIAKKLKLKAIDQLTPAGITLKRKDHWENHEQAYTSMRHNPLFKHFDESCFQDFLACGLQQDIQREGLTLVVPKKIEAEIFRTVPAWWWRTPRKAPAVPVHLISAQNSPFYKQGFPQGMKKTYQIDYSLMQGGHMFPLEQPEKTAELVKYIIAQQKST